ncbi:hypothetical protein GE09DRAFT_13760 [Coniochaeta sp. 2T2.1]|nr:hypothetical protein GE09DRAFT_13760 [Coniochaeta sp. 2T2.1]
MKVCGLHGTILCRSQPLRRPRFRRHWPHRPPVPSRCPGFGWCRCREVNLNVGCVVPEGSKRSNRWRKTATRRCIWTMVMRRPVICASVIPVLPRWARSYLAFSSWTWRLGVSPARISVGLGHQIETQYPLGDVAHKHTLPQQGRHSFLPVEVDVRAVLCPAKAGKRSVVDEDGVAAYVMVIVALAKHSDAKCRMLGTSASSEL